MRSSAKASEPAESVLSVKVIPGASRNELRWDAARGWVARIQAPPIEGRANTDLCEFVAREVLGLARASVWVKSGAASRQKRLGVALPPDELERRLQEFRR